MIRSKLRKLAGFLGVVVWSWVFVLASYLARENLFFLLGVANLVTFGWYLAGWCARRENIADNLRVPPQYLAGAVIGNGVFRGLIWASILLINPAETIALQFIWVVAVVLVDRTIDKQGWGPRHIAGLAILVAAIALLSKQGLTTGHAFAFFAGLIWTGYVSAGKRLPKLVGPAVGTAFLVSGVGSLILSAIIEAPWEIGAGELALAVAIGTIGSLGSMLWQAGMAEGQGRGLGLWMLAMPALSLLWFYLFGSVALSGAGITATLLVLAGSVTVSPQVRRKRYVELAEIRMAPGERD